MAIALHDLGGCGLEPDLQSGADPLLDLGRQVREGADGAGDLAHGGFVECASQAVALAAHLLVEDEQLEPEGRGLGVHAVGSPDAGGVTELQRATPEHGDQALDPDQEQPPRVADLERERRVEHVAGGESVVDVTRIGPHALRQGGEERDHVVTDLGLDLVDARRIHRGARADRLQRVRGNQSALRVDLADGELHREPAAVLALLGPDLLHLGARVAIDHRPTPPTWSHT